MSDQSWKTEDGETMSPALFEKHKKEIAEEELKAANAKKEGKFYCTSTIGFFSVTKGKPLAGGGYEPSKFTLYKNPHYDKDDSYEEDPYPTPKSP